MSLHPRDRCLWCSSRRDLRAIIVKATGEPAARCEDVVACVRRQAKQKRIRLEGRAA